MKSAVVVVVQLLLLLLGTVVGENDAGTLWRVPTDSPDVMIWPRPRDMSWGNDEFTVNAGSFRFDLSNSAYKGAMLTDLLERYTELIFFATPPQELPKTLDESNNKSPEIHEISVCTIEVSTSNVDRAEELGLDMDESYEIFLDNGKKCQLRSSTVVGIIRAIETFSQLVDWTKERGYFIRGLPWRINDRPKWKHRGFLIDTSRRFLPVPLIERIIDGLSYNKMNVLHWHITDAEAFPFLSQKHPNLVKGALSPLAVYSLDDMKHLAGYARGRGVRIIPEIDVPGHSGSWGIGMPELMVDCSHDPSITGASLNPANPMVFQVISDLWEEMASVFPDAFIHIGGDELKFECWQQNGQVAEAARDLGRSMGGKDGFRALYCQFMHRVFEIGKRLGKTVVMWDDVNKAAVTDYCGIDPDRDVVFQIWHDHPALRQVLERGHRAIVSLEGVYYLNNGWERVQGWAPWSRAFGANPSGDHESWVNQILGGEFAMWGESTDSSNHMQHSLARLSAGAERLWFGMGDTGDGKVRMVRRRCSLLKRGLPCRAMDFDNGDWRRGRLYQCEVYLMEVAEARGDRFPRFFLGYASFDPDLLLVNRLDFHEKLSGNGNALQQLSSSLKTNNNNNNKMSESKAKEELSALKEITLRLEEENQKLKRAEKRCAKKLEKAEAHQQQQHSSTSMSLLAENNDGNAVALISDNNNNNEDLEELKSKYVKLFSASLNAATQEQVAEMKEDHRKQMDELRKTIDSQRMQLWLMFLPMASIIALLFIFRMRRR